MSYQTLDDVCVEQNFLHQTYHLRGVINEVVELLTVTGNDYNIGWCIQLANRLNNAMRDFGAALEAYAERLPEEEIEEIEE